MAATWEFRRRQNLVNADRVTSEPGGCRGCSNQYGTVGLNFSSAKHFGIWMAERAQQETSYNTEERFSATPFFPGGIGASQRVFFSLLSAHPNVLSRTRSFDEVRELNTGRCALFANTSKRCRIRTTMFVSRHVRVGDGGNPTWKLRHF